MVERAYDIALFGATGFTGGLTADYLAANAPPGTPHRTGAAGRDILSPPELIVDVALTRTSRSVKPTE